MDVASKVKIQRLKQAQNALAVPHQPHNHNVMEEEQLMNELKVVKHENDEMKEHGAFDF